MKKSVVGMVLAAALAAMGASNGEDPFADATVWLRGWADANGDGVLQGGEVRSTLARPAGWSYANMYNSIPVTNEWVTGAYRGGKRLTSALYFPQAVTITNETLNTGIARISTFELGNFTATAGVTDENYSFAIRFRPDDVQFRTDYCWIFNWGYSNRASGFNLGLKNGDVRTENIVSGAVTNKITFRRYTPDFFKNGNANQPFGNIDRVVYSGVWHDLVVSLDREHGKIRYLLCRAGFDKDVPPMTQGKASDLGGQMVWSNEVAMTTADDLSYKPASWLLMGSEANASGALVYENNGFINGNATKCFRGSIEQFAVWNRALDFGEMKKVLAWPRGDVMRVGVQDGTANEFRGGAATSADGVEWTLPQGYASGDSATVTFVLDRKGEEEMPQIFRWYGADDSAVGNIGLSVNGRFVDRHTVQPGRAAYWTVSPGLLVAGTNTLTVARTDAGPGLVKLDAAALGGSWQIGHKDGSFQEFAHESAGRVDHDVIDGNWYSIKRVLFGTFTSETDGNAGNVTNMVYHFVTPKDFQGARYGWTLGWKDNTGSSIHLPRWKLNGHDLGYAAAADGQYHTVDIPDEYMSSGENLLEVYNAGTFKKGNYYHLDYIRFMVNRRPGGTMMLVR